MQRRQRSIRDLDILHFKHELPQGFFGFRRSKRSKSFNR
jgi:hypothetical protein